MGVGVILPWTLFFLEIVQIIPAFFIPARQEPDIALFLGHPQLVGLAHDVAGCGFVKISNYHFGSSFLQILQVLEKYVFKKFLIMMRYYYQRHVHGIPGKLPVQDEVNSIFLKDILQR